jgi:phosphatidylserine/phosphatidylglycerophosphate/cardiolipin synthase-like enzyme
MPRHPNSLPESFPDPDPRGPHAVQVLRTYGSKRPRYPFAPNGERSIARAYEKAFAQANRLIYVEDQYLWSGTVAQGIVNALERSPELRVLAVVPRYPDQNSATNGPPQRLGQLKALTMLKEAAPDRVAVFDLESDLNVPIYVHAKICIVDDVWFTCGSDNFNRRSWTNDSELTCAVIDPTRDERHPLDLSAAGDGARKLARDLRLELWSEHLGRKGDDPELLDPATAFDLWKRTAADLDAWHAAGRPGSRPPGQIRAHNPEPVEGLTKVWAEPAYRVFFDPDDRPWRWRDRLTF